MEEVAGYKVCVPCQCCTEKERLYLTDIEKVVECPTQRTVTAGVGNSVKQFPCILKENVSSALLRLHCVFFHCCVRCNCNKAFKHSRWQGRNWLEITFSVDQSGEVRRETRNHVIIGDLKSPEVLL